MNQHPVSSSLQLFNNQYFTPKGFVSAGFVVAIAGSAIALLANRSLLGPVGSPGCIAGLVLGGGLTPLGFGMVARGFYAYSQLRAEMKRVRFAALEQGVGLLEKESQKEESPLTQGEQVRENLLKQFTDTLINDKEWTEGVAFGYESLLQFTYLLSWNVRDQENWQAAAVNQLTQKFLEAYRFGSLGVVGKKVYLQGPALEEHKKRFQTVGDPLWRCHVVYQALADEINRLHARVPEVNPMEVEV